MTLQLAHDRLTIGKFWGLTKNVNSLILRTEKKSLQSHHYDISQNDDFDIAILYHAQFSLDKVNHY